MVVLQLEDYDGNSICNAILEFNDDINDYNVVEIDGDFDVADIDFDDYYGTNERRIRLQKNIIDYERPDYRSMNIKSCVSEEEQELASYEQLKEHYLNKEYYYCKVLIWNYFGHIDYSRMGYNKSHSEIISILFENLLFSIQEDNDNFISFVDQMIDKIKYWLIDGPY